jgi:hypothetical protein
MKKIVVLSFLICLVIKVIGQQASIVGSIADTVNYKPMAYSSIVLIRKSDSVLVAHQWATEKSTFSFTRLQAGNYVLRITRPTFADYEEDVKLASNEQKNVGNIIMLSKANLLRDVIIREKKNAITIKGDTTEYLVDSFLVNQNSNVEDLLKKLPGLQVDKNGKITAQGQEVKKVLVDGEEFFGDDPTVATRNLKANNVESVQVFDKKSDQAAFSGIEDGVKDKTINLTLKEDAKKGYFGKVSGGLGTQDRYEHDAMFNKFKNKQKISMYAATSNTNNTGLSWEDNQKYGAGNNMMMDDESGNIFTYYNGRGESFDGVGIPTTIYAGAVYADKFKTDTHSINLNLKYQQLAVKGYNNNYTKYILPDTLYFNNQLNNFNNSKQLIKGGGNYEWHIDSLTSLKLFVNMKELRSQNLSEYITENLNENNEKVNTNNRTQTADKTDRTFDLGLDFKRKFKTKGRSLIVGFNQSLVTGESDGFLKSSTNFYEGGVIKTQADIDQQKLTTIDVNTFTASVNYTEPLSAKWFIVSDASTKINVNVSERKSLDKDANGNYTIVLDSFSNVLRYDIAINKGGLALKYNTKKLVFSFGGKVSYTDLRQKNVENGVVQNQYFFNLFPDASLQYKVRNSTSLNIRYNGRTRQPSLQDIQPIIDNSNPLDIMVGNPTLEQSFSNTFSVSYNDYKAVSGSSLHMNASYTFAQNDFTRFDSIDMFGRRFHKTVNVDGNKQANYYMYYWFDIPHSDFSSNINLNCSYNENNNFINGLPNRNFNSSVGPSLGLDYEMDEIFEIGIGAEWDYNRTKSSLRSDIITQYWVSTYSANGNVKVKKKYKISTELDYNYRQQTVDFPQNFNTLIWNASLSRSFLKRDNFVASISCNDILNQNIGFRRDASSNYINENSYSILKRYFMVNLVWNFTKGGAGGE